MIQDLKCKSEDSNIVFRWIRKLKLI